MPDLDDAYIGRHALPGEDWQQARMRLESLVFQRYQELPCPACAAKANSMAHAALVHMHGDCSLGKAEWPAAALNPAFFKTAQEQCAKQTESMAAVARNCITVWLDRLTHSSGLPLDQLLVATRLMGFLEACDALGVFTESEQLELLNKAHRFGAQAERELLRQGSERDPR